jgi:hypothetical protein
MAAEEQIWLMKLLGIYKAYKTEGKFGSFLVPYHYHHIH